MSHSDREFVSAMLAGFSDPTIISSTTFSEELEPERIPALTRLVKEMDGKGYQYRSARTNLLITETRRRTPAGEGQEVSYALSVAADFIKGDGCIRYAVVGHGETPNQAIAAGASQFDSPKLRFDGEPLPLGKGQIKKAKEIGLRLILEHREFLQDDDYVLVRVHTRGGRYGHIAKIARREFKVGELLNPVKKPKIPSIMCELEERDYRGQWRGVGKKKITHLGENKIALRRWTYQVGEIGTEFVIFHSKANPDLDVYRLTRSDWDRLQAAVNKASQNA